MRACFQLLPALLCSYALDGQTSIRGLEPGGAGRLFPFDAAVLDLREPHTSLPCLVRPAGPELGFDFAFHAGYEARVRLRDLAGPGETLTAIFRVTPSSQPERRTYFEQKWRVPPGGDSAQGAVALTGSFSLGEGEYEIDWLLRDEDERVCSAYWKISARPPAGGKRFPASLAPGVVVPTATDLYGEQGTTRPGADPALSIAILLNAGAQRPGAPSISSRETQVLLSMLRGIGREPRIGSVSITAFNLEQGRIIFEQENVRHIDLAGLRNAIENLNLGTVSVDRLADKDAEARFLVRLAPAWQRPADALIFLGPKAAGDGAAGSGLISQLGRVNCPVFYLTYTVAEPPGPWSDLIGRAVKYWKGREFIIMKPLDLIAAWSRIMAALGPG